MIINVLRSLKEYFKNEKRRTAILDSLIAAIFNYFTSLSCISQLIYWEKCWMTERSSQHPHYLVVTLLLFFNKTSGWQKLCRTICLLVPGKVSFLQSAYFETMEGRRSKACASDLSFSSTLTVPHMFSCWENMLLFFMERPKIYMSWLWTVHMNWSSWLQ